MDRILVAVGAVLAVPVVVFVYTATGERVLPVLPYRLRQPARAWWWLAPFLVLSGVVLVLPTILTLVYSLRDGVGLGFANYGWAFGSAIRPVLRTNLIWVVVLPLFTVALGLLTAVCLDRVKYERVARTLIILPTAVSFAAAAVTWRMIYTYQPAGRPQTGVVNALWTLLPGATPVAWLNTPILNTFALIMVAAWVNLGVVVLVFSAAVKALPSELLEAARLDGAGELRVFWAISFRLLWPSIVTVLTTQVVAGLKIFDIVYVMTNGRSDSDVIANRMYSELFVARDLGHASAIAVLLLLASLPVVVLNLCHLRRETT